MNFFNGLYTLIDLQTSQFESRRFKDLYLMIIVVSSIATITNISFQLIADYFPHSILAYIAFGLGLVYHGYRLNVKPYKKVQSLANSVPSFVALLLVQGYTILCVYMFYLSLYWL